MNQLTRFLLCAKPLVFGFAIGLAIGAVLFVASFIIWLNYCQ